MLTKPVELHEEAASEYDAAFDWYLERSPEAARKFDAEFSRALAEIARAPQRWASGSCDTRRFLLRKFPFLVIYRERLHDIQVLAVATPAGDRDIGKKEYRILAACSTWDTRPAAFRRRREWSGCRAATGYWLLASSC